MPGKTILDISVDEQGAMLTELRAARYGYLLALDILLLCAQGRTPSEIAGVLFCSRSSVYRVVAAYRRGERWLAETKAESATAHRLPILKRALVRLIKRTPQSLGWCRTRWSCAALALEIGTRRRVSVSRETIRRWLHERGLQMEKSAPCSAR